MPLQFIGMIRTDNVSEIDGVAASQIERSLDPKFVADFARAHEEGGFERILIGYHTRVPMAGRWRLMPRRIRKSCMCCWRTGRGSLLRR